MPDEYEKPKKVDGGTFRKAFDGEEMMGLLRLTSA